MAQEVDAEIEAIKTVLTTLRSLDPDARQAVVEYVLKRLDLPLRHCVTYFHPQPNLMFRASQTFHHRPGFRIEALHANLEKHSVKFSIIWHLITR